MKMKWMKRAGNCTSLLAILVAAFLALPSTPWAQVQGAVFTTVDEAADGSGHCQNGNPAVNCNIYDGKEFVWLNGGPVSNGLSPDGTYFFAVLAPGGQSDPNDGGQGNLSDDFDTYLNRSFTVSNGEVGAYSGTHDFDNGVFGLPTISISPPFIRLAPYADTPNPGGVYIMAVCQYDPATYDPVNNPVKPSKCKYDAFKVKAGKGEGDTATIDVAKFCDANADGFLNPSGENGLQGWAIAFTPDPNSCSGTTDQTGGLSCDTPAGSYTIGETVQSNFLQTATCIDGFCGTCSSNPAILCNADGAPCPGGATDTCVALGPVNPVEHNAAVGSHGIAFGNVGLSAIQGRKFSDLNVNGADDGEAGVQGIKILLSGTAANGTSVNACAVTDASGNYSFGNLLPGAYTVTEVPPAGTIASTATSCSQTLAVDAQTCAGTTATCDGFGNVCLGAGGGLTLGYWSNKNGFATMNDNGEVVSELTLLTLKFLRTASGASFDPATYATFRTWLLNATATNMAYMLSAQLATMALNVEANFVNGGALVYAPSCGTTGPGNNFISISNLMSAADAQLQANSLTTEAANPADRAIQECLKNALDAANNNKNFVVACPASGATCQ